MGKLVIGWCGRLSHPLFELWIFEGERGGFRKTSMHGIEEIFGVVMTGSRGV